MTTSYKILLVIIIILHPVTQADFLYKCHVLVFPTQLHSPYCWRVSNISGQTPRICGAIRSIIDGGLQGHRVLGGTWSTAWDLSVWCLPSPPLSTQSRVCCHLAAGFHSLWSETVILFQLHWKWSFGPCFDHSSYCLGWFQGAKQG